MRRIGILFGLLLCGAPALAQVHPPAFSENLDYDGTACTAGPDGRGYVLAVTSGATSLHCCEPNAGDADGTTEVWFDCSPAGGGGGTPGGSTTQVQYNNSGAFGGDAGLLYTSATDLVTIDADGTATNSSGIRMGSGSFGLTQIPNMIQTPNDVRMILGSLGYAGGGPQLTGVAVNATETGASSPGVLTLSADAGAGAVVVAAPLIMTGSNSISTITGPVISGGTIGFQGHTLDEISGSGTHLVSTGDGTIAESNKTNTWSAVQTFTVDPVLIGGATFGDGKSILVNITNPYTTKYGIGTQVATFSDCNADGTNDIDHVMAPATYNFAEGSTTRISSSTYGFADQWELSYCPSNGASYLIERNEVMVTPNGTNARCWGETIEGDNTPIHGIAIHRNCLTAAADYAFNLTTGGNIGIYNSAPTFGLDIGAFDSGTDGTADAGGNLRVRGPGTSYGSITIGRKSDTNNVLFVPQTLTAQRQQFPPDADGYIAIQANSDTTGMVRWGDATAANDTGNEVCALAGVSCVDVKSLAGVDSDCTTVQVLVFYALCRRP